MSLLVLALIVVLIVALAIYAIDLLPIAGPPNTIAKVLVIAIAILLLCDRAGLV